jgi:aerobic carbon-monoxide dehydrogenase small subunit
VKETAYPIRINVNGEWRKTEAAANETLLHLLRERLGHTEVKEGCGKGDCGTCAVLLNGEAVNACLTLALQADGQKIVTLRGIGSREKPHPLQESFVRHGAIQCGFCTSGMIISAKALLDRNSHPTREQIREAISGNLCRCTGYRKVVDAIEDAAARLMRKDREESGRQGAVGRRLKTES